MTRANVVLVTNQGKFKFQANSSAYPSNFGKPIFDFIKIIATNNSGCGNLENGIGFYEPDSFALAELISDLGLSLGTIGNFSYVYEFDFVKCTFKVWDYKTRWVNAPSDWEKRGWICWKGENGKYGYSTFVKGKKIFDTKFINMVKSNTVNEDTKGFKVNIDLLTEFEKL